MRSTRRSTTTRCASAFSISAAIDRGKQNEVSSHSPRWGRAKLPAGRRSSRPRKSRENKSGSRLAFQGSNMMKLPRRNFLHLAAGAATLPAVSRIARAQTYPTRPVRLIVGAPAGGGFDIVARLMGQWLSERLGQSFVIENRPGAGSNIATEAVVRALPDGYTLLLVSA